MRKKLLKSALMVVAGVGLMAGSAMAAFITGSLDLTGTLQLSGGSSFATATGIDFLDTTGTANVNHALVGLTTGNFTGLTGSTANVNDFTFAPFTPNNPLWAVGGFSFNLTSVTVDLHNASFLVLTGAGTMSKTGFDDTTGSWSFSTQYNPLGEGKFTWSAGTQSTNPVPEPTTMLLFGAGIAGLAGIARRRKIN